MKVLKTSHSIRTAPHRRDEVKVIVPKPCTIDAYASRIRGMLEEIGVPSMSHQEIKALQDAACYINAALNIDDWDFSVVCADSIASLADDMTPIVPHAMDAKDLKPPVKMLIELGLFQRDRNGVVRFSERLSKWILYRSAYWLGLLGDGALSSDGGYSNEAEHDSGLGTLSRFMDDEPIKVSAPQSATGSAASLSGSYFAASPRIYIHERFKSRIEEVASFKIAGTFASNGALVRSFEEALRRSRGEVVLERLAFMMPFIMHDASMEVEESFDWSAIKSILEGTCIPPIGLKRVDAAIFEDASSGALFSSIDALRIIKWIGCKADLVSLAVCRSSIDDIGKMKARAAMAIADGEDLDLIDLECGSYAAALVIDGEVACIIECEAAIPKSAVIKAAGIEAESKLLSEWKKHVSPLSIASMARKRGK